MSTITLQEVYKLALPALTTVVYGEEAMNRTVSWAVTLRAHAPAFPELQGGELAFIALADVQKLDANLSLSAIVRELAKPRVAAIAVQGEIDLAAIRQAELLQMPLLHLPDEARLAELERTVIRLIVDKQSELARFGERAGRQLTQLALDGAGLSNIAQAVARLTRKSVLLQDAAGGRIADALNGADRLSATLTQDLQADTAGLIAWGEAQATRPQTANTAPIAERMMDGSGLARMVALLTIEGQLAGYLSLIAPANSFDAADRLVLGQGALASALELSKQRALAGNADIRRSEWLHDLLAGEIEEATLERQCRAWGYDLEARATLLLLGRATLPETQSVTSPDRMRERWANVVSTELARRRMRGLVINHEDRLALIVPVSESSRDATGHSLANALADVLATQNPQTCPVIGIGRAASAAAGLRRAYAEAEQALTLAQRLPIKTGSRTSICYFGDLGVYRLLLPLRGSEELTLFYRETLAALVEYDARQNTDLVKTLAAYFENHGNLSRTAEVLFLHRNTLIYRMERIAAITKLDLEDPEARLILQLALKVRAII